MPQYKKESHNIYISSITILLNKKLTRNTGKIHIVKLLFNNIKKLLISVPPVFICLNKNGIIFLNLMIFFFTRFINIKSCIIVFLF